MAENGTKSTDWQEVIARSLAYIALHNSGLREKDLATQGAFLEKLGLPRKDTAEILGTTSASLTELLSRVNRKKGISNTSAKAKKVK